jgi:hypothetical protein
MAVNEDEIRKAENEFDNALREVKKALPGKPGFGIEARYGQAYQRLVRLGARPQIRLKHRG